MKRKADQSGPYQTFEDLEVYQVAREFRKAMYRVARKLPDIEKFELAPQIRGAAVSLTNNIAEGHGRYHFLDHIRFILQSRGSLEELLDDLNICEDEDCLPVEELLELKEQGRRTHRVTNGYIRYLRGRVTGGSSRVQESADSDAGEDEMFAGVVDRFNSPTL
jgi:four helix bundle protein